MRVHAAIRIGLFVAILTASTYTQYGPESSFPSQVGADYPNRPIIKTEFSDEDRKKYGDVAQFRHYRFNSNLVANLYRNFNPDLTLTVYEYKDPEAPVAAISSLQEASRKWPIKTPEIAITAANSLFRLKGHCNIPDTTWQEIVDLFLISVLGKDKNPDNIFVMTCGQDRDPIEPKPLEEKRPTLRRRKGS
ncbi:MAG TPA: hypothetical protein VMM38_12070 [Aridibacter sp.]|nr:hypothetical protein [Aridibacter sp.]